jgi:large subunit ribosomal protein L22
MEARASARHVRVTPSKTRQVVDLIRGKYVDEALRMLTFTRRHVAKTVAKVLQSAVANAANQEGKVEAEDLFVKSAVVGAGPTMKRFLPRAQGRATPILKRSCHITIVVADHGRKRARIAPAKAGARGAKGGEGRPGKGTPGAPESKTKPAARRFGRKTAAAGA